MTDDLIARLREYLRLGGLWNPELMDGTKTQQLIIDSLHALEAAEALAAASHPQEQGDLIKRLLEYQRLVGVSYTQRFEETAERFYGKTGLIAPGKSVPLAMPQDEGERARGWAKFQEAERLQYQEDLSNVIYFLRVSASPAAPPPWQPIETCPKMRTVLLFAVTDVDEHGTVKNWKMATGSWLEGYEDERSKAKGLTPWKWDGWQLKIYDHMPTHWSALPSPPAEGN